MRILGIHDGHNATACLYDDGKLVGMVSEERFSRKKNHSGFPALAVEWLIKEYAVRGSDLDLVAVPGQVTPMQEFGQQAGPWYRLASTTTRLVPASIMGSQLMAKSYVALRRRREARTGRLARHLAPYGVPESRIRLVDHHTAHAHAAYWLDARRRRGATLVVTLDNTGDGLCGSVSIVKDNDVRRVATTPSLHSVGMMYTAVTRYLGLKPVEDEHKVMGLAPYARGSKADVVAGILKAHMDLSSDGLRIVNKTGLWEDAYVQRFRSELALFRFDAIAGGVQRWLEEVVVGYLKAWTRATGIRKLALGGGVFMNVKANMLIEESNDFEEVFFLPSCGDESIAAGAALKCAWELSRATGQEFDPEPLGALYLGPHFGNEAVEQALKGYAGRLESRRHDDIERKTAELLAANILVGRMSGRMEFGARALGNRSILARADSLNNVRRINAAIKMRDFWMPFCPAMLAERRHDYIVNPQDSPAPYMVLAFPSTPLAEKDLIAALHPFDLTCRPQLVDADFNPKFHHLLKAYEATTGSGGVLNTSFNLHGEPVVCTPVDAIETYLRSDLDVLTIEDYLVWDPRRTAAHACLSTNGAPQS